MEFSEFHLLLGQWCATRFSSTLDCWIDEANARLTDMDGGVRCSIDLLGPGQEMDPGLLREVMSLGSSSMTCGCSGALAFDPETGTVVLVTWLPTPYDSEQLLACLELLANQRTAMLSLVQMVDCGKSSSPIGRKPLTYNQARV